MTPRHPSSSSLTGTRLGAYRILDQIGKGGMGVVYEAEDTRLRRRVALKVLPAEMAANAKRLRRFEREAKAVAALSHPGIVTLHSVEEVDGLHFLTMELIDGPTLSDVIHLEGRLPVDRVIQIGLALANALAAAHDRGVLHRDVKPSNVMVDKGGWIKLLDFGLAKLSPSLEVTRVDGLGESVQVTLEGHTVGTLGYMSPEQLRGLPADERSDIFSLGLVLYEMLTAAAPFAGDTSAERIAAVLRDEPQPLSELRPDLPRSLVQLVERCLEKEAEDRFPSAALLREELETIQRQLEISHLMESGALPTPPPSRLRPGQILAGALVVVALAALAIWGPGSRREPPVTEVQSLAAVVTRPTVAVLPLSNLSGDPPYFVEGMTDALIGALARTGGLTVISRQSAMRYRGSTQSLAEIAEDLGVDYLVEGSVARQGDTVHVQARLIRPDPEEQVWAEAYDRPIGEVFALHDEIGGSLAAALGATLTGSFARAANRTGAVDPMAYEAYLQGRYWGGRFEDEDLRRARGYFERAIGIDPTFARAWAGLAETLITLGAFHAEAEPTFREAETAARRALQLDDLLPEAHALLGDLHLQRWEWKAAEEQIQRALELDPSSAVAHRRYWMLLACQRRFEEARREIEAARRIDPLSAPIVANVGIHLIMEGRLDEAEAVLDEALEIDPEYTLTHAYLWLVYHSTGQDPERGEELVEYLRLYDYETTAAEAAGRLPEQGYEATLAWVASELAASEDPQGKYSALVAGLLAASGQREQALRWLEHAYDNRVWDLAWVGLTPDHASLWDHPRLEDLLRRVGVPTPSRDS